MCTPKNEKDDNKPNIERERAENDRRRNEEIHRASEQKEREKANPQNGSFR